MGQKKLWRFEQIKSFDNVFQYPENVKGTWHAYFGNNHPIYLELACGKGEYAVGLGRMYPQRNFIGIDLKGNRIYVGANTALKENLKNVAFIRSQIEKITDYFAEQEIAGIWITFPDPQLRISKSKKRLTHPRFLKLYQKILQTGAPVHLKTDSPVLYRFTKLVCKLYQIPIETDIENVYEHGTPSPELSIQTHYEKLDIAGSQKIHYLKFILPKQPLPDLEAELKKLVEETEVAGSE